MAEWWSGLFQQTIDDFYQNKTAEGMYSCEQLLSIPGLPAEIETATRRNQTWYVNRLANCVDDPIVIDFPHQKGWSLFNPSIANGPAGELAMIARSSNYRFDAWGRYIINDDNEVIRTRNYFVELNDKLIIPQNGIAWLDDSAVTNRHNPFPVHGLEDMRLFWLNGWSALATVRDRTPEGICTQLWVDIEVPHIVRSRQVSSGHYDDKNWMPSIGRRPGGSVQLIDRCYPVTVTNGRLAEGWWYRSPFIARSFRGGSQAIPLEGNGFYFNRLAVVHESITMEPYEMIYIHRFVEFGSRSDGNWKIARVSNPFVFEDRQIEFCAGIAELGDHLVLSYGVRDAEARLMRIPKSLVKEMLREPLPEALAVGL